MEFYEIIMLTIAVKILSDDRMSLVRNKKKKIDRVYLNLKNDTL